ncbi:MAG: diaminopimelate epimerase [Bacteroidia bacterium]|nr:diaminopimelate epimerase [Bacteroidia bacterium]
MKLQFEKYQGTGNDFVMIDNRSKAFDTGKLPVSKICDRKFGIGADGLIVIEHHDTLDFNMIYFNSDGSQSFCGNGSRCAVAYAKSLGMINSSTHFLSTDGEHYAEISDTGEVRLKMHDVHNVERRSNDFILDTGSPHYIIFEDDLENLDLVNRAREIRYNSEFKGEGINVNFIKPTSEILEIRTYERGVEDETLSCGTGVTAAVLADFASSGATGSLHKRTVKSQGGTLRVEFKKADNGFNDIYLIGPAKKTFQGVIELT